MRLGQFARKYDIRVQDLISYLESDVTEEIHSNTKLSDKAESDILDFFGIKAEVIQKELPVIEEEPEIASESKKEESQESEVMSETVTEEVPEWDAEDSEYVVKTDKAPTLPETPLDDIASVEGEIAELTEQTPMEDPEEANDNLVKPKEKETIREDEVIQTDKLLEMLESEDLPVDFDKIKLIKAYKKELSGLKVLDKIELPEDPRKKAKEKAAQEKAEKDQAQANQRPQLSEEEREKRRLKAKQKKEAYEAREARRRKEKEAREAKARKEAHYKWKLEQAKVAKQVKQEAKKQEQEQEQEHEPTGPIQKSAAKSRPESKTMLGKFWRWMNT